MTKRLLALAGAFLLAACASPSSIVRSAEQIRRLDERRKESESADEFRVRILQAYDRLPAAELEPARLSRLHDDELEKVFGGVSSAFFYTEEPRTLNSLEAIFAELERRGAATNDQTQELYRDYLIGRRAGDARRLAQRRAAPALAALPRFEEDADLLAKPGRRAYEVSPDGTALRLMRLPSTAGLEIIMLARPSCVPSNRASREIESDLRLKRLFADHARVLNAPSLSLSADEIARWNLEHPVLKSAVAYSRSDWPGLELGTTPVFYLYKDGRLVRTITGWTASSMSELSSGLRDAGVP